MGSNEGYRIEGPWRAWWEVVREWVRPDLAIALVPLLIVLAGIMMSR